MKAVAASVFAALIAVTLAFAADTPLHPPEGAAHPATTAEAHAQAENQAILPPAGIRWPVVMMMIVIGMFLAAVVIGPIVRANMPEEPPVAHHDESHGHGGHH